jgi:hypothetical protein
MFPVYINRTKKNVDFDFFIDNFQKICKYHQAQGRASAFAFIIYDFHNPHLTKVLMDTDYWNTLDKTSGDFLTVFSLFEEPTKHKLNNTLLPKRVRMKFEAVKVETTKELGLSYREIIETFFGGADFRSPSILFFQVDNEEISDYFFVELKENKIEDGFNELKELIDKSVEATKDISLENKSNYREIFHMLEVNVNSAVWWKKTKRRVIKVINLISFLSIFKPG